MTAARFRFVLRRAPDGAGYTGEMTETGTGWPIQLQARVVERDGARVLEGTGTLGPTPEALRLPGEDAMRDPENCEEPNR